MENNVVRSGLPPDARCVYKGVIFEVWQWDQEMFDGTTKVFEKIWRFPTVEAIVTIGDKILIEEQDQPDRKNNITLPSGRADQGEDFLEEMKRELLEETGCVSDDWELFIKQANTGKVIHDIYIFIARNCRKIKEPELDSGEKIKTKLIAFDELIKLADNPQFWVSPYFINYLLRCQLDPKKEEEFRKLLFP